MKTIRVLVLFMLLSATSFAQSDSFQTLKDKFSGTGEVYHFSVSGWLCRAALSLAGEYEFKDVIEDVNSIRIITIPKHNFQVRDLSVKGFRKVLENDQFQALATFKDHGDNVDVYLQENGNKRNRYFVLIEEPSEVTAVEIKGSIDLNKLNKLASKEEGTSISYQLR